MLTITITATGKTSDDLELAIGEVTRLLSEGNTSGFNRNETGSFTFDISGEEECGEDEGDDDQQG